MRCTNGRLKWHKGGGSCEATDSAMLAGAMERASAGLRDSAGDEWDLAGVAD